MLSRFSRKLVLALACTGLLSSPAAATLIDDFDTPAPLVGGTRMAINIGTVVPDMDSTDGTYDILGTTAFTSIVEYDFSGTGGINLGDSFIVLDFSGAGAFVNPPQDVTVTVTLTGNNGADVVPLVAMFTPQTDPYDPLVFDFLGTNLAGFADLEHIRIEFDYPAPGSFSLNSVATPEPSTAAMLGLGLLGLARAGRRVRV